MDGDKEKKTQLSVRDLVKLASVFGSIMAVLVGALSWIQADIAERTIPRILNQTAEQIEKAIDRHSNGKHAKSLGYQEFQLWAKEREKTVEQFTKQILSRLDKIEDRLSK